MGSQAPKAIVGIELLMLDLPRGNAGNLLCRGTFELRLAMSRPVRHAEVEARRAEPEIEREVVPGTIASGPGVR